MFTRICRRVRKVFFTVNYRFQIFTLWLGVVSLVSYALVLRRTWGYKSAVHEIRLPIMSTTESEEKLDGNVENNNAGCNLPVLDPFHSTVVQFMKDLGKLQCNGVSYSRFKNNVLRVEGEGIVSAKYRKIERTPGNDFGVVLSDPVEMQLNSTSGNPIAAKERKGNRKLKYDLFYVFKNTHRSNTPQQSDNKVTKQQKNK